MFEAVMLLLLGSLTIGLTYYKPRWYWEHYKARFLRKCLGDRATALVYYTIGAICLAIGLVAMVPA